jgi:hypothetical protein
MTNCAVYTIPLACLGFLLVFAVVLFWLQAHSTKERGGVTTQHSDRIYKDFEMYLKVVLGLVTAFGYVRFNVYQDKPMLARQALIGIGAIALFVMVIFCLFVICHQGSKIRRWENIEWKLSPFWQENWACLAMWVFSSAIWVASFRW